MTKADQNKKENDTNPKGIDLRNDPRCVELVEQKQFFEAMFQTIPVAVVTLDLENRIIASNPAFETLFGYKVILAKNPIFPYICP